MNYTSLITYLFVGFMLIISGCAPIQKPTSPQESIIVKPSASTYKLEKSEVRLPDYDINNAPISVWVITEGVDNVGIIIAGHAEKAVCQVASIAVITAFEELGDNKNKFVSFGIGFDIRPKSTNLWSPDYNAQITELIGKLNHLREQYPNQVKINVIQYNQYQKAFNALNNQLKYIKNSVWDTHVVEYKYDNSPLIIPFQYFGSDEVVTFKLSKSVFGEIPYELALDSLTKKLDDAEKEIKKMIEDIEDILREFEKGFLEIRKPKTGKIIRKNFKTLNEAKQLISKEQIQYEYLQKKITRHEDFLKLFKESYDKLHDKLSKELANIAEYREKIQKIKEKDIFLIDAFLRGWAFSTSNEVFNSKLDNWYDTKRAEVWQMILSKIPQAKTSQLGGIFHSDDVFFKVVSNNDEYEITPYKIIGGDFIQVLNKKIGITQYFTQFNFRDK